MGGSPRRPSPRDTVIKGRDVNLNPPPRRGDVIEVTCDPGTGLIFGPVGEGRGDTSTVNEGRALNRVVAPGAKVQLREGEIMIIVPPANSWDN